MASEYRNPNGAHLSLPRLGRGLWAAARSPLGWLIVQLVIASWFLATTGALQYRRVPDTASYLETAEIDSPSLALAQYRTIGYPAFLELFRDERGVIRLDRIPAVQWSLFVAAVVFFFLALTRSTGGRWLALAAASPLVYSSTRLLVDRLQPDFLAATTVIASFAFFFLLLDFLHLDRPSPLAWSGFAISVFVSYQLRPASLFLVLLFPALGGLVAWTGHRVPLRQALRAAGRIAVVTLLPLLAFSGLRWASVGHFGLVSFGGFNAMGMAACFLDHRLINDLPEEHKPLARSIFRERRKRGYEPLTRADDPRAFYSQYSPNIFSISVQQARRHLADELGARAPESRAAGSPGHDWPVAVNRELSELAREIVRRRPVLHYNWVRAGLVHGTGELGRWLWITWPALLLLLLLPLAVLRRRSMGVRSTGIRSTGKEGGPRSWRRRYAGVLALVASGAGLCLAYLIAVSLVSYPFPRYFLSTILLLPSALVALVFETARSLVPLPQDGAEERRSPAD